jgi:Protein of unknown function (DUF2891)
MVQIKKISVYCVQVSKINSIFMKKLFHLIAFLLLLMQSAFSQPAKKASDLYLIDSTGKIGITLKGASFIAAWNTENFQKEFPHNRVSYFESMDDIKRPKELNPAFYGYADWHSAVHSHWTMVKLLKMFPSLPEAKQLRSIIDKTIDPEKIKGEIRFFSKNYNIGFEYPYGQSWLLKLAAELHSWNDPQAKIWYNRLLPLTKLMEAYYFGITFNTTLPDRYGHHENTAFAMINAWDYANEMNNDTLRNVIIQKTAYFFRKDKNAPVLYEPSNQDFLSPNFLEAALVSSVADNENFGIWIKEFMPGLMQIEPSKAFEPQRSETNSHLKGYNLTKAYCLNTILKSLDKNTPGYQKVKEASNRLIKITLPLLMDGDFNDSHWLGSFILLATTSSQ